MPSPFRSIAIATGGSAVIIAVTLGTVFALWRPSSMDAFVPSENTVAVFKGMTREQISPYFPLFPELTSLPGLPMPTDIAMVEYEGRRHWLIAPKAGSTDVLPLTNVHAGRNRLIASDASLQAMLDAHTPPLRDDARYRAVMRPSQGTSIYVADSTGTLTPELETLFAINGKPAGGPAAIHWLPGGITVSVLRNDAVPHPLSEPAVLPSLPGKPDVVVTAADLQALVAHYLSTLPEDQRTQREARLRTFLGRLSHGTLSWTYDLLPALRQSPVLALKTGSGSSHFLMGFTLDDATQMRDIVSRMHAGAAGSDAGMATENHAFDDGLSMTVLRAGTDGILDKETQRGPWKVRTTELPSGTFLMGSAVRGKQAVISNDRAWLTAYTGSGTSVAAVPGSAIVNGALSARQLETLERESTATSLLRVAIHASPAPAYVFALRDGGDALHLTLEPVPDAVAP